MTAQILDYKADKFVECDARTLVAQIGTRNVLAISGGRVLDSGHGVILPVAHGYKVTVDLAPGDTYTVRRSSSAAPRCSSRASRPTSTATKWARSPTGQAATSTSSSATTTRWPEGER